MDKPNDGLSEEEKLEKLKNAMSKAFEIFLDEINEQYLDSKMELKVRTKNIGFLNKNLSIILKPELIDQLYKDYDLIKCATGKHYIEIAITENKKDIIDGNFLIVPAFKKLGEIVYEVHRILVSKKKDTIGKFREAVKKFISSFLPQGKTSTES